LYFKHWFLTPFSLFGLKELDFLFSLPQDQASATLSVPLPDPTIHGIRVTCKDLAVIHTGMPTIFEHFNQEVMPGKRSAFTPARQKRKRRSHEFWQAWKHRPSASSATRVWTFATSIFRRLIVHEG
jgi:hypothetical protein